MPVADDIPVILVTIDKYPLVLPIRDIRYIIHAVAVTPIPDSPAFVVGAINYHGEILPVVDLRKIFGLKDMEIAVSQYFAIVSNSQYSYALILDDINGQEIIAHDMLQPDAMQSFSGRAISSAVRIGDVTHYVLNTEKIFTDADAASLIPSLTAETRGGKD